MRRTTMIVATIGLGLGLGLTACSKPADTGAANETVNTADENLTDLNGSADANATADNAAAADLGNATANSAP